MTNDRLAPAISARNLGKLYKLQQGGAGSKTFRDLLTEMATAPLRRFRQLSGSDASLEDFWALQEVSFDIMPGEVVGIIGRNGAGKSTLLKILSRIVEPTRGQATMRGRVASLLEVGTGFHPELTGRENIYLNGSILGMRKVEIDAHFDEIVAFAEIDKFLDTPVKRYSSGMYVRLAFAVAAHLQPEILIVDEVLAVGDAEFQKKCLGKMREVSSGEGRTVLFVSHNMAAVTALCKRAFLFERGRLVADGTSQDVVAKYLVPASAKTGGLYDLRDTPSRSGGLSPIILAVRVMDESLQPTSSAVAGQRLRIEIDFDPLMATRTPMIHVGFNNARGERVFAVGSYFSPTPLEQADGLTTAVATFLMPPLYPGSYEFDIAFMPFSGRYTDHVTPAGSIEVLHSDFLGTSYPYNSELGNVLVASRWETVVAMKPSATAAAVEFSYAGERGVAT
jgi:homopolymeric O-antigen transport system ATP-binding protein